MKLDLVTLSVPLFFVGILIELLANRIAARDYYVLGDSLGSIGTGVLDQIMIALTRTLLFTGPYIWVYEHLAPIRFTEPTLPVIVYGLLLGDFGYYWGHRWTHEINFLWTGHVVHHSSEQYNLSTALRQNWFASLFLNSMYLPMALSGISPLVAALIIPFIQLYQFWIHTRMIGKLGAFELLFNTPSHHRVHHGINPQYVDRNYAGIFIIWDRLFGTFAEERAPVVYGVLKPLKSYNPVRAWLQPWGDLFKTPSLACWWKPPGWDSATGKNPDLKALFSQVSKSRYRPKLAKKHGLMALVWFLAVLASASVFLFAVPKLSGTQALVIGLGLIGLMALYGAWIERRCR